MANPFTKYGGKVKFTPGRVATDGRELADVDQSMNDAIRNLALERDLVAADLLEGDKFLDMLDAAIDDQLKDFEIPGNEAADAASALCGSPTINWECYKKAKALLQVAPWIANGYDPVQSIFGDRLQKRAGKVIMNCQDFDPGTFFDGTSASGDDNSAGDSGSNDNKPTTDGGSADDSTESLAEINKKAQANQKSWALNILFWDFIWGKPYVKDAVKEALAKANPGIDEYQEVIQDLRAVGRNDEADALAKQLTGTLLPNLIMKERPRTWKHLAWEAFPSKGTPIQYLTKNKKASDTDFVSNAAGVWIDPWSLVKEDDVYKDKGIPAVKHGFLLGLLIGALGLPVKTMGQIMKVRKKIVNLFKILKRIPIVGRKIFNAWKAVVSFLFIPWAYINNAFIELLIWLAVKPIKHSPDLGSVPPEYQDEFGTPNSGTQESVTDKLDIQDTPAGFVPMDCMQNAQEVVSRVDTYAAS